MIATSSRNVSLSERNNEINVSLLKLLVYCGIDFNKIKSSHFKHFFTLFDPSYKIPDVSDLKKIFYRMILIICIEINILASFPMS